MKSEKAPTTGKTKTPKDGIGFLYRQTISILALVFAIGLGSTIWYMLRLQSNLIETMALENAALYTQALAEFRHFIHAGGGRASEATRNPGHT